MSFLCSSSDFMLQKFDWCGYRGFLCTLSAYNMHNLSGFFSPSDDYCLCSSLDEADFHISIGCQDDLAVLAYRKWGKSCQEICWIFFAKNNGLAPSYTFSVSLSYLITHSSFELLANVTEFVCFKYLLSIVWLLSILSKSLFSVFFFLFFTVYSLWESTFAPLFNTLSLSYLHSATVYKLVMQPKKRREDAAGGRSDAILTSNWKPAHSLFPIKRPCQAREYEQDRARDAGRVTEEWETSWVEVWGWGAQKENKRDSLRSWNMEGEHKKKEREREKSTCQLSSIERWA